MLDGGHIGSLGQRLPHILMHCELEALICSGTRAGNQHTYALLDERVPPGRDFDREMRFAELTLRYLASHGPATIKDLAWWSGLTVADLKHALHLLGSEVKSEIIDGLTFWSTAADGGRAPAGRCALLLHGYDELLVGYNQSRYFGDPREPAARKAWTDRGLPTGLVLLDARVYGHWRRTVTRGSVTVEVVSYEDPSPSALRALESAAGRLGRFLGLRAELEARRL